MLQQTSSVTEIKRVRDYLSSFPKKFDIIEFNVDTSTSATAALALGVMPAQIAKSVVFRAGEQLVMVVTSGDMRVNAKALAQFLGVPNRSVSLADGDTVYNSTGYKIGGVCPFALKQPLTIIIDESMKRFEVVYAAAGTDKSAIPLSWEDMLMLTAGEVADVCKPIA